MVVVAQNARQLPVAVFVLPQLHEARFTRSVTGLGLGMQKSVHSHLNRSVAFHVVDPQSAGHQHPLRVTGADVVFDAFRELLSAQHYAALVMVKLDVIRQQAIERLEVTVVVSVEELLVQRGDGFVLVGLILDFVQCGCL